MALIKIKKGLDIPITGEPEQVIGEGNTVKRVALLGQDYVGMRPTMAVAVGDRVKLGQLLFTDKKMPVVRYTSPGCGKVIAINRGAKRVFLSMVIELDGDEQVSFTPYSPEKLESLSREKIKEQLIASGQWTAIRTRPFSKVADPETEPHSIFITAMDTNPLAPSLEKIIGTMENDFLNGIKIIAKLTGGKIHLCKKHGARIPIPDLANIEMTEFTGPHPSGNVGTHIHFLDPVHRHKNVWYVNAQDIAAIGYLFTTGKLKTECVISLAGPGVKQPRLIKTRMGAAIDDLAEGELCDGELRTISGSVLSGFLAAGPTAYLGRFHQQVSVLNEDRKRHFLGWMSPGKNLYSIQNIVLSSLSRGKKFAFTTSLHGGHRSIVPNGSYEKVMPLDILPTYLLRALAIDDVDEAEKLGCLELDEEDLALCTFVCPSKIEHGPILRRNLTQIEKEG